MAAARTPVSLVSRFYGLGSIYAKTLRDSRLAFIIMAGLLGGLMLVGGVAFGEAYGTAASRQELANLVAGMPAVFKGLAGNPLNIQILGGSISWKYGPFFAVIASLWSILALSGTLSVEARNGSLEFVATAPFGKQRIALEKLAAHLTIMALVIAILAVAAWLAGALFGTLPGDAISPGAAIGFAVWVGLIGLASGSVAFALAPFLGRAAAAGIAGVIMLAGFLMNGYQASVPAFSGPAMLSWFGWTARHLPLAGQSDWVSLVPVALVAVVLFAVGVHAFARRDLGSTAKLPWPGLPSATLGIRGPTSRSFGERLPMALAWGIGIGLGGILMGSAARSFAEELARTSPDTLNLFRALIPNIDITSTGGFLQVTFIQLGFIFVGFAVATLVAGWGSDESSGRLEMLLTTPLARARWAISGGIGVICAIGVMTALLAIGIGVGAAIGGGGVLTPVLGTAVLGLYAAALAGVGLAVGGLLWGSISGEVVALVVIVTFLIDLVAPALKLPDWVHQLALTAHMGQPMLGVWDWGGIAACLLLAIGGTLISGSAMARRDVRG
jgi:ABC-2 type transport system permease protein